MTPNLFLTFLLLSSIFGQNTFLCTKSSKDKKIISQKQCTLEKNVINSFWVFRNRFLHKVASKIVFEQKNIFATSDKKSKQV